MWVSVSRDAAEGLTDALSSSSSSSRSTETRDGSLPRGGVVAGSSFASTFMIEVTERTRLRWITARHAARSARNDEYA